MPTLLHSETKVFRNLGAWRDAVCEHFVPLEVCGARAAGQFVNRAAADRLGNLLITELRTSAQKVVRTRVLANRSDASLFKATLQLSGQSEITQENRIARVRPGEWALYDTARPYEVAVEHNAHFLVLQIPADRTAVWRDHLEKNVARTFSTTRGSGRIAMATLRSALAETRCLSPTVSDDIARIVVQMIGLNVLEQTGGPSMSSMDEVRCAQLRQIQHYINAHLDDTELSATGLAQQFRISRRYLYTLFSYQDTTPAGYILEMRLRRCRDQLADSGNQQQINEIAFAHGFSGAAVFSHAFRRRFGVSPSEWRQQSRHRREV